MKNLKLFILFLLIGGIIMQTAHGAEQTKNVKPKRVILLGASVGNSWKLPEWPLRMNNNNYVIEMIAEYAFDKSDALEEILMRPKRKLHFTRTYLKSLFKPAPQKPDILIIKECAAYFPGDLAKYKVLIDKWVKRLQSAGVKPVLATVVPVTKEHSQTRPGRLEGILSYNDWVREYTKEQNIPLLDLEQELRISDEDRSLRPDLTKGDGLHLNPKAYEILDKFFSTFLGNIA